MKKRNLKRVLCTVTAAAMTIGMAGCSSGEGTSGADKGQETREITLSIGQSNYREESFTKIHDLALENIGIDVQYEFPPDAQGQNLLQTQLATGNVPDIAQINEPSDYGLYSAEENFVPLDDEEWVDRLAFDKSEIQSGDGHIYAMPITGFSGVMGVVYNKQVFEDLNLDIPKTWDEFMNVCEVISGSGKTPVYLSGKDTWTIQITPMIFLANALDDRAEEVYDSILSGENKLADVPEFKEALEAFQDLCSSGYVNKDYTVGTYEDSKAKVASGEVGMIVSGEYAVTDIANKYPDAEIGMFPLPYNDVDKFLTSKYVFGLAVPKDSKNQEAALEFLNYMSQPECLELYLEENAVNSPFTDVESKNLNPVLQEIYDTYFSEGQTLPQVADMLGEFGSVNSDIFLQMYVEIASGGEIDSAISQLDAALAEYGHNAGLEGY